MPQQVYEKIILSIEITDVNDNSPVFRSSEVRLEIPEALGVGEEFEVSELIAKDADIADFATVSYSIVPPGTFDIAVKNGRTFLKVKITVFGKPQKQSERFKHSDELFIYLKTCQKKNCSVPNATSWDTSEISAKFSTQFSEKFLTKFFKLKI